MNKNKEIRLYNILLPLWLLIFLPTYLWLFLIPANYIIDRLVLKWGLRRMPDAGELDAGLFCRKHTWKICIIGFVCDLVGAMLMLLIFLSESLFGSSDLLDKILYGVGFNPFSHILSFLAVAASVALAGLLIFLLDRVVLKKAGLTAEQAKSAALRLAVFTAPYLFFFPSSIVYNDWSVI